MRGQRVFCSDGECCNRALCRALRWQWRILPIFGIWEAVSINSAQTKEVLPRPFTHDLFIDLCARFSLKLLYLQIDTIDDGVNYTQLVMSPGQQDEYLDYRPSDGTALTLRGDIPIFVEVCVLATVG